MVEVDEADQIIFSRFDVDRSCLAVWIQIIFLFYIASVTGTVVALGIAHEVAKKNYFLKDWVEASINVLEEEPILLIFEGSALTVVAVGILWWFGLAGASVHDKRQIRKKKAKHKRELVQKLAENPNYIEPVLSIEDIFPNEDNTVDVSIERIMDLSQSSAD